MAMNIGPGDTAGGDDEPLMEINTTPLIDVMLVLLVMLIITIPIQLHAVNLNLPVGTPPPSDVKPEIVKIDVDADPEISQQFSVMSIPTFIVFKDGQPVKRIVGAKGKLNAETARRLRRVDDLFAGDRKIATIRKISGK